VSRKPRKDWVIKCVRLSEEQMELIRRLCDLGIFPNPSEAIRFAINLMLTQFFRAAEVRAASLLILKNEVAEMVHEMVEAGLYRSPEEAIHAAISALYSQHLQSLRERVRGK